MFLHTYLSVEVGLLLQEPLYHAFKVSYHVPTEVIKLREKDVVESVTVLPNYLSLLLLQRDMNQYLPPLHYLLPSRSGKASGM
jgi:hypothetical protein